MIFSIYKQFRLARIAFYMGFALALGALNPAYAGAANALYTIEGVEVDITATNAVQAREQALVEAQKKAYEMLAQRVLSPENLKNFTPPSEDQIGALVQDFEVTNEQLSRVRYKGVFTIRFRPNALKSHMASRGKSVDEAAAKPVVVIPYFESGGRLLLWSDPNPWMQAWRSMRSTATSFNPVTVPLGDSPDVGAIGDDDLTTYDPLQLQSLASRYGADDVAITVAGFDPQSQGRTLMIDVYKHGFMGATQIDRKTIERNVGESDPGLFSRAAMEIATLIRQDFRTQTQDFNARENQNTFHYDQAYYPPASSQQEPRTVMAPSAMPQPQPYLPQAMPSAGGVAAAGRQIYTATARFGSVRDWVQIKSTLERIPGVQAVLVKTLRSREALIDIRYAGPLGGLQSSLQTQGIGLRSGYAGQPMDLVLINGAGTSSSVYGQ
jgi:hypothetical protein